MPDATAHDPFRGFKFRLTIPGIPAEVGFQKVSGLKEATEVVEYREGQDPVHKRKLPGLTVYDPITLSRGISSDVSLLTWRAAVAKFGSGGGFGDGVPPPEFRREVSINLYDKGDQNSKPSRQWKVYQAWPSELAVSDLNAEGSEILLESMVLVHEGLEPVSTLSTTGGGANQGVG